MRRSMCGALVLSILAGAAFAQEEGADARDRAAEAEERLRLAVSSLEYPVTPGDEYRLTYRQTSEMLITRDVLVEGDSTVDLGIFGKMNAYGLTFIELKRRVEELISSGYVRSLPSLNIAAPGVFRVAVRGDLLRAQYVTVWGLSRLSEVALSVMEPYTSLRTVDILSRGGERLRYDLFKAMRLGADDQDPCVRPGDVVILYRRTRSIRLSGEVMRPGDYELAEGEGLKELIESFGGGLTSAANRSRIRLDRNSGERPHSEYLSAERALAEAIELADGDAVVVPSKVDRGPLVWFAGSVSLQAESAVPGGVGADEQAGEGVAGEFRRVQYDRFSRPIHQGEYLSDVVYEVRGSILPVADLGACSLFRAGSPQPVPVDISALLAESNPESDIMLEADDVIYIPALRSTVSVSGAVIAPGFYPYRPGASASYYVSLAGGYDRERCSGKGEKVFNSSGKARKRAEPISAGDQVFVPSDETWYRAGRSLPAVGAVVGLFVNIVTLIMILNNS